MRTAKCDRCGAVIQDGGMRLVVQTPVTSGLEVAGAYALDTSRARRAELCAPCDDAVYLEATAARRAAGVAT